MGFFKKLTKGAERVIKASPIGLIHDYLRAPRKQQKHQEHLMWEAANRERAKIQALAGKQEKDRARMMRKISAGRVRSARRRIRGGLFGDISPTQGEVAGRLGG